MKILYCDSCKKKLKSLSGISKGGRKNVDITVYGLDDRCVWKTVGICAESIMGNRKGTAYDSISAISAGVPRVGRTCVCGSAGSFSRWIVLDGEGIER